MGTLYMCYHPLTIHNISGRSEYCHAHFYRFTNSLKRLPPRVRVTERKQQLEPGSGCKVHTPLSLHPEHLQLNPTQGHYTQICSSQTPSAWPSMLMPMNHSRKQLKTRQVDPHSFTRRGILPRTLLEHAGNPSQHQQTQTVFQFSHLHGASSGRRHLQ